MAHDVEPDDVDEDDDGVSVEDTDHGVDLEMVGWAHRTDRNPDNTIPTFIFDRLLLT